jgi:hypothetical protein
VESYIIKITGDVRKIVPSVNSFLEGERRRLRRKGVFFNVDRFQQFEPEPQKPENKPDIVSDYL